MGRVDVRGMDAAKAYVERIGWELTGEQTTLNGVFYAVDDGELVLVHVTTRKTAERGSRELATSKVLRQVADRRGVRVDEISLLVISEDRALLRHNRAAYTHGN